MPTHLINVLLIDDKQADVRLIETILKKSNQTSINLITTEVLSKGLRYIATEFIHVILLDLTIGDNNSLQTFRYIQKFSMDIPIVIMSHNADKELIYQAMKEGAQNYLIKENIKSELLMQALQYAIWNYYRPMSGIGNLILC